MDNIKKILVPVGYLIKKIFLPIVCCILIGKYTQKPLIYLFGIKQLELDKLNVIFKTSTPIPNPFERTISIFTNALMEECMCRLPLILLTHYFGHHNIFSFGTSIIFSLAHLNRYNQLNNGIIKHNIDVNPKMAMVIWVTTTFFASFILNSVALDEENIVKSTIVHFVYNKFWCNL